MSGPADRSTAGHGQAPARNGHRWRLLLLGSVVTLTALCSAGTAVAAPPSAADVLATTAPAPPTTSDQAMAGLARTGGPIAWGVTLDPETDNAAALADRLGAPAAVYAKSAQYPLDDTEKLYLRQFLDQVAGEQAVASLSVYPRTEMAAIDPAAAQDLAEFLAGEADRVGVPVLLAFAPEMNAPWRNWGQDPAAFRQSFRSVADAVHAAAPSVRMVWEPAHGSDYPFRSAAGMAGLAPSVVAELDTNGDGVVDHTDDPYLPYYPGDDVVDWVGLSLSSGNPDDVLSDNSVPPPGSFAADLAGSPATGATATAGAAGTGVPADAGGGFYQRFVQPRGTPMLVDTAVRYVPERGGADELDVKRAWWNQTFGPATAAAFPELRLVVWREFTAGNGQTDFRVTHTEQLTTALQRDMTGAGVRLGPVTPLLGGAAASPGTGPVLAGAAGWAGVVVVAVGVIVLLVLGLTGRARKSWHYPEDDPRDLRVDLLRGMAIVFVVVNHIDIPSVYQLITQEAIGAVSGAELFVLLAGVILGMVYRPRLARDGFAATGALLAKRAWKLYYTALFVIVSVYLISRIPWVDTRAVTTFTDQGTGAAGGQAVGRVYDLYGNMDEIFSYPVPNYVFADVLLLRIGPWQFSVIGLYVVLLLVAPFILWALRRHLAWVVLAVSWGIYLLSSIHPIRIFPSQFEDSFPLLTWQVLFVNGLVAGYYRVQILNFFRRPTGRVVLVGTVLIYLGFLFFTWNNPYQANSDDPRLALIPDNTFRTIYQAYFTRTYLGIGRLLNVAAVVVTFYAALTTYWTPIKKVLGGFLIPLGQSSLYVFIMHVYFAVLIANLAALQNGWIWLNTLAYTLVLAALWVMVRRRFLFRIIPR